MSATVPRSPTDAEIERYLRDKARREEMERKQKEEEAFRERETQAGWLFDMCPALSMKAGVNAWAWKHGTWSPDARRAGPWSVDAIERHHGEICAFREELREKLGPLFEQFLKRWWDETTDKAIASADELLRICSDGFNTMIEMAFGELIPALRGSDEGEQELWWPSDQPCFTSPPPPPKCWKHQILRELLSPMIAMEFERWIFFCEKTRERAARPL